MRELFDAGRIPPFAMVFPETQDRSITDRDKNGKHLLQFGFILTDGSGRVLPYSRTKFAPDETEAGHRISLGRSVLVGWSPVTAVNGRPFPQSEGDVRDALNREVAPRVDEPPAKITFLGLARRSVVLKQGGEAFYYFYLFEAQYSGKGPVGESLVKDRDDRLDENFTPIDDVLLSSLGKNKVDLRAIEAITGRDLAALGSNEVEFNRFSSRDSPPFLVRSPGVFFCHSSKDKPFALDVAARLEAIGIPTWVDHARLRPGEVWFERAFEAVRYCQVFLLIASSHSVDSVPCHDELVQAMGRKQWLSEHGAAVPYEIVPVVLDGERTTTNLPRELGSSHTIDCRNPTVREEKIATLIEQIMSIVPPVGNMPIAHTTR